MKTETVKTDYSESQFKINARKENINLYRKLTGNRSIPFDRQYWTLCNIQPLTSGSEIVQLLKHKMIVKQQFFGVDIDNAIIEQNKLWHPEATFVNGDWLEVIGKADFNPGMIYLDATSFADHDNAIRITVGTMLLCPKSTVMFVNLMMNDPRSRKKFSSDTLIEKIQCKIPRRELEKWEHEVVNYEYSMTRQTTMRTFVFHKKG